MLITSTVILLFSVYFAYSLKNEELLVNTSLGTIRGHYKNSNGGRTFAAFEGIPYAKPPVGDLRFAEPIEAEPWTGIWNATTVYTCIQSRHTNQTSGVEDCLYLNVYVPKEKLNENENLDVLMHIHGGSFMSGSSSLVGPDYVMDRNIVYVSINYRLGPLGFLSTEDEVVPGNNGLKDQVQALKWIRNNIKYFGGNPKSVTITGMSAGGASVHLHYFSPLSRNLFHRGIVQSGTALAPWAIQDAALENAKKLAVLVGCNEPGTKDFIRCMRQKPVNEIIRSFERFDVFAGFPLALFTPVIERPSLTAFLMDYPYKLLQNNESIYDVPLIFTTTTEEGLLGLYKCFEVLDQLNERWNEVLPYVLDYNCTTNLTDKVVVAQKIKEFYFNGKSVSEENIPSFIRLFSDRYFKLDFELASRMHAKIAKSPIYSYMYGYNRNYNFGALFGINHHYGVGHAEDGHLLYKIEMNNVTLRIGEISENDKKIRNMLLDFITSFAKSGKPETKNITWNPVTNSGNFNYLFIHEVDDIKMVSKEQVAPFEFWHSLPLNEYEKFRSTVKSAR